MFVPIHDKNPVEHIKFQFVTIGLIAINVFVFVFFQSDLIQPSNAQATLRFALVPIHFINGNPFGPTVDIENVVPLQMTEWFTLVSYMFLHGNWLHLISNMAFLWVFGDNVEDAMGHTRFLIFYLLCGVFAGIAHSWVTVNPDLPLIGASGAVSGVVVAYLMLHPNVRIWVLLLWRFPVPISARIVLSGWVILQFVNIFLMPDGQTAWGAHVGGIIAGAFLILFMRRPNIGLFDRT